MRDICPVHVILLVLLYLHKITNFGASCYAGFFCLLSTHLSLLQIFSSGPHSHTLQSVTYRCPLRDRSSFTPLKGGEIQVIAAVQ
jgi:hypothetical protein